MNEIIKNLTRNKDDQARIAISIVQHIPYDKERELELNNHSLFPYEVLYNYKGICGDKSLLLALLLRELGFGVAIFEFEKENHRAVGIKCPRQYSYMNSGYCFVETTRPEIITYYKSDYVGVGKLTSQPEIIKISDGLSFDSVKEEYEDAQEFDRLNKLAEMNNQILDSYNYSKWKNLSRKYDLT